MPKPQTVTKAIMQEIGWDENGRVNRSGRQIEVQFNPESLKVNFSNQIAGGDQSGGSAIQFSGRGTTKLSFDLWFDVTDPTIKEEYYRGIAEQRNRITDVRRITKLVADFMQTKPVREGRNTQYAPPGVRFLWGTFLFEGVMVSLNETLEFFSEDGKPLRASVAVSLTKQDVEVKFGDSGEAEDGRTTPGTEPRTPARDDDTMQGVAARQGNPEQWPQQARDNNVENPRHIPAGTLLR